MASIYPLDQLKEMYVNVQRAAEDGLDVTEALELVTGEIHEKLEAYAMIIKNLQSDEDGLKSEIERLNSRKSSLGVNIKRLKQAMADTLELIEADKNGKKRFKSSKFTVSFRESTAVVVDDVEALPTSLVKIKYEPDKTEIKKAIENGAQLECVRFVTNKSLQIR